MLAGRPPLFRLPELSGPTILVAVLVAIASHALSWPTHPFDFDEYLYPWYRHILQAGPIGAFAEPFSNYTPAYLYLLAAMSLFHPLLDPFDAIKLLSLAGTLLLGFAFASLVRAAGASARWLWFSVFLVPSVVINGSKLGQCDSFWVAACLLAVASALNRRVVAMLVFAGLGVAFKAQASFIAPLIIAVLIRERAPLHLWLIPPAVYILVMLPAWLAGWPAQDLALIYLRQSQDLPGFISFAQQPWYMLRILAPEQAGSLFPLGFAAAAAAALWIAVGFRGRLNTPRDMLLVALLSASLLPYLLPKMHERYWLLADMLAFALALAARDRPHTVLAIMVQASSLLALTAMTHSSHLAMVAAFVLTSTCILLTLRLLMAPPGPTQASSAGDLRPRTA